MKNCKKESRSVPKVFFYSLKKIIVFEEILEKKKLDAL